MAYGTVHLISKYFNYNPDASYYTDTGFLYIWESNSYIGENSYVDYYLYNTLSDKTDRGGIQGKGNTNTSIDGATTALDYSAQFFTYTAKVYFAVAFTKSMDLTTARTRLKHFHFYTEDGTPLYRRDLYIVQSKADNNRYYACFNLSKESTGDNYMTWQDFGNSARGVIVCNFSDYEETKSYKVTSNLENCTITPTDTSIKEGTQTTFTVTANEGFRFDTVPTINDTAMTKTSDTVYTSTITVNADVTINATATAIPTEVYYKVTSNLENCTITPTDTSIKEGTQTTFTVTANEGFRFDTVPTINDTAMTKTSDTVYTSTITVNADVTINATATAIPTTIFTYGNLTNCVCNYSNGENLSADKAIIFTANDGYFFNSYNITWVTSEGTVLSKTLNGETATFLTTDEIADYISKGESIEIHDVSAIKKPVDIINGVNLYSIDNDELISLMNTRFVVESDNTINDFGKYITNLYILPFDISSIIGDVTNIILGTRNSGTKANILNKNSIDIDLGKITIPDYENAYEMNAIYRLYLPFINDIVTLDTEFIVNHTINIKYHIDLIEESITIILANEENTEPFYYNKYSCGRNLPFFNTENGNTNLQYSNNIANDFLTAFIIKTVNNAYNDNSKIGKNTYIYDVISNYEGGYIECENIKLEGTTITDNEETELESILRNGVYINE